MEKSFPKNLKSKEVFLKENLPKLDLTELKKVEEMFKTNEINEPNG